MNIKNILLTTAAATLLASAAQAKDFTGSLFLPSKGEVLSNTTVDLSRAKIKHFHGWAEKDFTAGEELTVGVTDNFSIYGSIDNAFNYPHITNRDYNNEHNFSYEIGGKYNFNYGRWLSQLGLGYMTWQPRSWYGKHKATNRWLKYLGAEAQIGYDMCNGFVPYASFSAVSPIGYRPQGREIDYSAKLGAHQSFDKVALDAGIRYDFETHGDNTNEWYAEAEANYFVTPKVAVGLHGDLFLAGNTWKYDRTIGAQLKVLF
ncbi:MAG: hypothetical protein J6039_04810 [Alphaproteobacteria bacterium]|nr:hypothetical protein [Alphaproteobacteria bacterium]